MYGLAAHGKETRIARGKVILYIDESNSACKVDALPLKRGVFPSYQQLTFAGLPFGNLTYLPSLNVISRQERTATSSSVSPCLVGVTLLPGKFAPIRR